MIIKAHQRGDGRALALYLLHNPENDIVEVHDLRGFAATDLVGALMEIDAVATGTRCRKPMFSLSFNPPPGASVSIEAFEKAFAVVERRFELQEQARAVVFHEKPGDSGHYRRHAHVVYSRIDVDRMRALDLALFKRTLQRASREIYHELGIEAPDGFRDPAARDPRNYDRQVWMQAKRLQEDPRDVKALIRDAFLASDSRAAFERKLAPHALILAKGDRRGHVLVHHSGEVISVSKYSGIKPRDLTARLGPADALPPVQEVQHRVKTQMQAPDKAEIRRKIQEANARRQEQLKAVRVQIDALKARHGQERAILFARQHEEWKAGQRERADRLRKGLIGAFDRLTGTRTRIAAQNVREQAQQKSVHQGQKQSLIDRQIAEKRELQLQRTAERQRHTTERQALREQLATASQPESREKLTERFTGAARPQMGDPGYAEWREAQREATRDRRSRGETDRGSGRGREPG